MHAKGITPLLSVCPTAISHRNTLPRLVGGEGILVVVQNGKASSQPSLDQKLNAKFYISSWPYRGTHWHNKNITQACQVYGLQKPPPLWGVLLRGVWCFVFTTPWLQADGKHRLQ